MDLNLFLTLGGFGVSFLALLGTAWWRITVMIKDARTETATAADAAAKLAITARDEVANHRIHVAEHYVSKAGLREVRDEIMGAITNVNDNLGRISERMDRIADRPSAN